MDIKRGDLITIAGIKVSVPNPDRRWWQFWRPKHLEMPFTHRFKVTESVAVDQATIDHFASSGE